MSEFHQSAEDFCARFVALKPDIDIVECAMLQGASLALAKLETLSTEQTITPKPQ